MEILKHYPPGIIEEVCGATTGIATHENEGFVVNTFQLRSFCDKLYAPILNARRYEEEKRRQERRIKEWLVPKPPLSPKILDWIEDMKRRHANPRREYENERRTQMERANKVFFERECVAAGVPSDSSCSPYLAKMIKGWKEGENGEAGV